MKKVFFVGSLADANKSIKKKGKSNNYQVIGYVTKDGISVANFELPMGSTMVRDSATGDLVLRFPMKPGDVLVLGDDDGDGYKGVLQ